MACPRTIARDGRARFDFGSTQRCLRKEGFLYLHAMDFRVADTGRNSVTCSCFALRRDSILGWRRIRSDRVVSRSDESNIFWPSGGPLSELVVWGPEDFGVTCACTLFTAASNFNAICMFDGSRSNFCKALAVNYKPHISDLASGGTSVGDPLRGRSVSRATRRTT